MLKPFDPVRGREREWWNGTEKKENGIAGENNTNHFRRALLFMIFLFFFTLKFDHTLPKTNGVRRAF